MKSNKDENEPLKIEIKTMKKIKTIYCIIFLHWRYLFCWYWNFVKQIFFRNKVPVYDTIWVLTLQYENNLL